MILEQGALRFHFARAPQIMSLIQLGRWGKVQMPGFSTQILTKQVWARPELLSALLTYKLHALKFPHLKYMSSCGFLV